MERFSENVQQQSKKCLLFSQENSVILVSQGSELVSGKLNRNMVNIHFFDS